MSCVFCGGSPLTNEHVFPQWLNRYLPSGRRQQLEQARYGAGGFDIERPSLGLDFRVRKVCGPCNHGWMSRMEADSIEILDPLISGFETRIVSRSQQRALAVWATKTAMMTDLTQAEPILAPDQRRRMRTHRAIPGSARIWIGACREIYPLVTNHTVRIELENLDDPAAPWPVGFYSPMKIGHLCAFVYFPQADVVVQHPPIYHLSLARIWPRRGSDIAWPGFRVLPDGDAFEEFSDRFWRELRLYTPQLARRHNITDS